MPCNSCFKTTKKSIMFIAKYSWNTDITADLKITDLGMGLIFCLIALSYVKIFHFCGLILAKDFKV